MKAWKYQSREITQTPSPERENEKEIQKLTVAKPVLYDHAWLYLSVEITLGGPTCHNSRDEKFIAEYTSQKHS